MGSRRLVGGRHGGLRWDVPPQTAFVELADWYASAIHRGVVAIAQKWAPIIENWMKENAPWTDRTGNARQGLHTEIVQVVNSMVRIIMSHGVDYGIWLEVRHAGRYAIVSPALDHFAPKVWADVLRLVGR